ncbi:MAG TPA: superoxide dismutase [Casimicrobiaceae bacterium]|nr:superoxide dismutase [Casimicrobiaceae bacterium]
MRIGTPVSIAPSPPRSSSESETAETQAHTLPDLSYDRGALAPVISAKTVDFHYGRHHKRYIDNLNKLIGVSRYRDLPLERIVLETAKQPERIAVFHNAAQVWNHNFYWRCLRPNGGGIPPAVLRQKIEASFESMAECKRQIAAKGSLQFGSGWVWLVLNGDRVEVLTTGNADGPLTRKLRPLITIDVWEHAYYLDYQDRRSEYLNAVLDKLIDWGFAAENLYQ